MPTPSGSPSHADMLRAQISLHQYEITQHHRDRFAADLTAYFAKTDCSTLEARETIDEKIADCHALLKQYLQIHQDADRTPLVALLLHALTDNVTPSEHTYVQLRLLFEHVAFSADLVRGGQINWLIYFYKGPPQNKNPLPDGMKLTSVYHAHLILNHLLRSSDGLNYLPHITNKPHVLASTLFQLRSTHGYEASPRKPKYIHSLEQLGHIILANLVSQRLIEVETFLQRTIRHYRHLVSQHQPQQAITVSPSEDMPPLPVFCADQDVFFWTYITYLLFGNTGLEPYQNDNNQDFNVFQARLLCKDPEAQKLSFNHHPDVQNIDEHTPIDARIYGALISIPIVLRHLFSEPSLIKLNHVYQRVQTALCRTLPFMQSKAISPILADTYALCQQDDTLAKTIFNDLSHPNIGSLILAGAMHRYMMTPTYDNTVLPAIMALMTGKPRTNAKDGMTALDFYLCNCEAACHILGGVASFHPGKEQQNRLRKLLDSLKQGNGSLILYHYYRFALHQDDIPADISDDLQRYVLSSILSLKKQKTFRTSTREQFAEPASIMNHLGILYEVTLAYKKAFDEKRYRTKTSTELLEVPTSIDISVSILHHVKEAMERVSIDDSMRMLELIDTYRSRDVPIPPGVAAETDYVPNILAFRRHLIQHGESKLTLGKEQFVKNHEIVEQILCNVFDESGDYISRVDSILPKLSTTAITDLLDCLLIISDVFTLAFMGTDRALAPIYQNNFWQRLGRKLHGRLQRRQNISIPPPSFERLEEISLILNMLITAFVVLVRAPKEISQSANVQKLRKVLLVAFENIAKKTVSGKDLNLKLASDSYLDALFAPPAQNPFRIMTGNVVAKAVTTIDWSEFEEKDPSPAKAAKSNKKKSKKKHKPKKKLNTEAASHPPPPPIAVSETTEITETTGGKPTTPEAKPSLPQLIEKFSPAPSSSGVSSMSEGFTSPASLTCSSPDSGKDSISILSPMLGSQVSSTDPMEKHLTQIMSFQDCMEALLSFIGTTDISISPNFVATLELIISHAKRITETPATVSLRKQHPPTNFNFAAQFPDPTPQALYQYQRKRLAKHNWAVYKSITTLSQPPVENDCLQQHQHYLNMLSQCYFKDLAEIYDAKTIGFLRTFTQACHEKGIRFYIAGSGIFIRGQDIDIRLTGESGRPIHIVISAVREILEKLKDIYPLSCAAFKPTASNGQSTYYESKHLGKYQTVEINVEKIGPFDFNVYSIDFDAPDANDQLLSSLSDHYLTVGAVIWDVYTSTLTLQPESAANLLNSSQPCINYLGMDYQCSDQQILEKVFKSFHLGFIFRMLIKFEGWRFARGVDLLLNTATQNQCPDGTPLPQNFRRKLAKAVNYLLNRFKRAPTRYFRFLKQYCLLQYLTEDPTLLAYIEKRMAIFEAVFDLEKLVYQFDFFMAFFAGLDTATHREALLNAYKALGSGDMTRYHQKLFFDAVKSDDQLLAHKSRQIPPPDKSLREHVLRLVEAKQDAPKSTAKQAQKEAPTGTAASSAACLSGGAARSPEPQSTQASEKQTVLAAAAKSSLIFQPNAQPVTQHSQSITPTAAWMVGHGAWHALPGPQP